jgi:hypothetical protein
VRRVALPEKLLENFTTETALPFVEPIGLKNLNAAELL